MINEAATVLSNDMIASSATPSTLYWAASGASFAYLFSLLTQAGVTSVAMGMLSGFSANEELKYDLPFYPSMSLTDWATGEPNARYWVLKLLSEHIKPDLEVHSAYSIREDSSEIFCAASDSRSGYPDLMFSCDDQDATLIIDFGSFGTPYGVCGNYSPGTYCHDHSVLQFISRACNEKNACTVQVFPLPCLDPCKGFVETFRAQARCTKGKGKASPVDKGDTSVLALKSASGRTKKILLINHRNEETTVSIEAGSFSAASMWIVDENTSPTEGPAMKTVTSLDNIKMAAFATVVISLTK